MVSIVLAVFRTNSVKWEKRFGDKKYTVGHALCPIFSLLCHSCVNNTRYTISGDHITVRACVPIKAGEEITSQYRGPNEGNILRRLDFPNNWKFECDCVRCMDPTELGTHSSTLVCPQCKKPDLYPRNSTMRSDFECRSCTFEMSYDIALEDTNRADKKLKNKTLLDSVESWEALLVDLETLFHPNHFLCMKTIKTLIQLYGLRKGYTLTDMSEELINRKLELCRRFIGKLEFMLGYRNIIKTVKEAAKCRQFMERNEEDDKMMGEYYKKWIEPLTNV